MDDDDYVILNDLAKDHPLRRMPLSVIQAETSVGRGWRACASWKIGALCFNDLTGPWVEVGAFRCPRSAEKAAKAANVK